MTDFYTWERPEEADPTPVDELAIDVARDYCETCGRHMDGRDSCPACGDEDDA